MRTVHANGDRAQYLDHVFRMQWVSGEPFAADDESTAAVWFDLDDLPPMTADMRRRIELSAGNDARTVFDANGSPPTTQPG
jgi:hypothetical protein